MKKLLIIISACNEAISLQNFLPKLFETLKKIKINTSVLLIDDGSTDGTASVAESLGCFVIRNRQNHGIGFSLRLGYKKAVEENFDFTFTMDADGQHDETLLPKMFKFLSEGKADIVAASRYHRKSVRMGVPIDRDMLNIATCAQVNAVTGWNATDPLCGFWGMNREAFTFVSENSRQDRYGFHLENLIKFWFLSKVKPRRVEVPHPAIYENHGTRSLLTRDYSPANKELRLERFGVHALNILDAIQDVEEVLGIGVVKITR